MCKLEQMNAYLKQNGIHADNHELRDLIGRLGGFDDKLTFAKFQERYLRVPGFVLRKEADITFLRLLYEEIQLEKQLDEQRIKILKRWDYNAQILFKKLSSGTTVVDSEKMKKFFIRIRQTVTDEDIELLLRRIGNGDKTMNFDEFCQMLKTQKQRATDKVDIPVAKNTIKREASTVNYMDKLRRKYKPLQQGSQVFLKQSQQIQGCQTPRAKTPTTNRRTEDKGTEVKQPRTRTPHQNTEPKSYINDTKELNTLISTYLNQQRCLQNVLTQLDEVVILKSLSPNNWHKEWQKLGVNSKDISYEQFQNVLTYYDDRLPLNKMQIISEIPTSCVTVADNIFDLLRDQEQQLQKAKGQFLREGALSSLDRYFTKGYMDVLDVFSILEHSTMSTINLTDAELLIAKFNKFNGSKTITRKALLNELT